MKYKFTTNEDSNVTAGVDNDISPGCIIVGTVNIGNNNKIRAFAAIGFAGENRKHGNEPHGVVEIGNDNVICEGAVIQSPCKGDVTIIGNNCMVAANSYIGHDAQLSDNVTITAGAKLGGGVKLGKCANIGLNAVIHQGIEIGDYAMIGMGSVVTRPIPPFYKVAGNPAMVLGINRIGMERAGFTEREIGDIEKMVKPKQIWNGGLIAPAKMILEFKERNPNHIKKWKQ